MAHPTPHGDKLRALLENVKLPENDRPRIEAAVEKYDAWIVDMKRVTGSGSQLVDLFEEYLTSNPFRADAFRHFLKHLERLLNDVDEQDILSRGWF